MAMDFNPSTQNFGRALGAGGIGAGILGLFGNENPADVAMPFLNKIPGEAHKELDPWVNYGWGLTQDPGGRLNQIGQGYQQSPGFKFALQQALQGAGHAAAAGGMAGSPQHEQWNMGIATDLANQDYNTWLQNALGLHEAGYGRGQQGSKDILDQISQALAAKSGLAYKGQAAENEGWNSALSNLAGGAATLAAFL